MNLRGYNDAFEFALAKNKRIWEKSYSDGVNYSFPIPNWTMKDCFNYWGNTQENTPYVIYRDITYSYGECNVKARKIANGLKKLGCKKDDRILIYLPNNLDLILICQACFKLGLIVVIGNPLDTDYEVRRKMADCTARIVIVNEISAATMFKAMEDSRYNPQFIIYCGEDSIDLNTNKKIKKILTLSTIIQENNESEPVTNLNADDIQVLQYTGGTTGFNKGCCHTNRGYIANALGAKQLYAEVLESGDWSTLVALPMSHIAGFTTGITVNMVTGGTIVLMDGMRPSLQEVVEKIEKYKPTIWPAVPVQINRYVNTPSLHQYDLSSLKIIVCGAAPLPVETILSFKKLTGININEGYGLTEALRSVTLTPFCKYKQGKTGIPYPNVDVLIVDIERGTKVMPLGHEGEIIVRSPSIMKGYWENQELTENQIKNGWLYTGDIGLLDEDGFLEIMDRKKDVIIISGFNVYPREIDEVLNTHSEIIDSCTVGIPDEEKGQVSKSYIVKKSGSNLSKEDIFEYCRQYLTKYKIPKRIEFVDFIPMTKNNKPDRTIMIKGSPTGS